MRLLNHLIKLSLCYLIFFVAGCNTYSKRCYVYQVEQSGSYVQAIVARYTQVIGPGCSSPTSRTNLTFKIHRFTTPSDPSYNPLKAEIVLDASIGVPPQDLDDQTRVDFWMGASDRVVRHISKIKADRALTNVAVLGHKDGHWQVLAEWRFNDPLGQRSIVPAVGGQYLVFPQNSRVLDVRTMEFTDQPELAPMLSEAFAYASIGASDFFFSEDLSVIMVGLNGRITDEGEKAAVKARQIRDTSYPKNWHAFFVERAQAKATPCELQLIPVKSADTTITFVEWDDFNDRQYQYRNNTTSWGSYGANGPIDDVGLLSQAYAWDVAAHKQVEASVWTINRPELTVKLRKANGTYDFYLLELPCH